VTSSGLTLGWTANGNPQDTAYLAEISRDGFVNISSAVRTSALSAAFSALEANTAYQARVWAVNFSGVQSQYSSAIVSTATASSAPGNVAVPFQNLSAGGLTFSWGDGGNAAGTVYAPEISTSSDFSAPVSSEVTTNLNYIFTGLSVNATYYARVRALGVDNRHIGVERGHGRQSFSGVRTRHGSDRRIDAGKIGTSIVAHRPEGQAARTRLEAAHHPEVRVLLDLELASLHRSSEGVQRADPRVSGPAEDHLAGAAGGDQLVDHQVGREPGERQIVLPLPDDLVTGREADEVREALDDDRISVPHETRDRVGHRLDAGTGGLGAGRAGGSRRLVSRRRHSITVRLCSRMKPIR